MLLAEWGGALSDGANQLGRRLAIAREQVVTHQRGKGEQGTIARHSRDKESSMSTFQNLISLVLLVYVLSVIVQGIQEFIKKVLSTKATVMEETVKKFMGESLSLPQVKGALARRGLDITALENLNKQDFRHLLDGIEFKDSPMEGIVKTAGATIENIKDNIAGSYESFRAAFQQAYTKKNNLFVLVLSFMVVLILNANLIVLYDQILADQAVQQALVGKAALPRTDQSGKNGNDQSPADLVAAVQNTRDAITKDLQDYPILLRTSKFKEDYKNHPYTQIPGLLIMGFLVSLGAPFWNDLLKGMTGINNVLNTSGKQSS